MKGVESDETRFSYGEDCHGIWGDWESGFFCGECSVSCSRIQGTSSNSHPLSKAKRLLSKGCEVVQANVDDVRSLEEAIADSYGVFTVTNYWALFGEEMQKQNPDAADTAMLREIKQGKAIACRCVQEAKCEASSL